MTRRRIVQALTVATVLAGLFLPGALQARPRAATVLVMAVADTGGPSAVATTFMRDVERLSNGQLVVTVRVPTQQTSEGELTVIRDLENGAVSMGWIPTRAWDAVGVQTFAPLQAPFLITSYPLLQKVLDGSLGKGMLGGTRASGVRTLGLAAIDLHVPLGARHRFVAVSDFHNATLRFPSNSSLTAAIIEALGGKAASIASGAPLFAALKSGQIDGAVTAITVVLFNGYYGAAAYLTTNLVFFPVVGSVGINEQTFEALSPHERAILTKAATEMTRKSFAGILARDQQQLGILCRTGLKMATSSKAQLAGLRRAEQPVYAKLEANRATAAAIAKIQALKKTTKVARTLRIPAGCGA
jgi:TRAP-type C4-dicarboxylate transport system substrate-binding protein